MWVRFPPGTFSNNAIQEWNDSSADSKGFRRIFSRFEKLGPMFTAFIHIALIFDALFYLNAL